MGILNKFSHRQMERYVKKHGDALLAAMQKVNEGGDMEDIDTIVADYFYLLKAVLRRKKPSQVTIDHVHVVVVDGVPYNFDEWIRHNDAKNTERKMEIEVLFSDNIPRDEVQKRLNEKIEKEW